MEGHDQTVQSGWPRKTGTTEAQRCPGEIDSWLQVWRCRILVGVACTMSAVALVTKWQDHTIMGPLQTQTSLNQPVREMRGMVKYAISISGKKYTYYRMYWQKHPIYL